MKAEWRLIGGMVDLTVVAQTAAAMLAAGALDAIGGSVGLSALGGLAARVEAVREYFSRTGQHEQTLLAELDRQPQDAQAVQAVAEQLVVLARRDGALNAALDGLAQEVDQLPREKRERVMQIAQKIVNIDTVNAQRDFTINL